MAESPLRMQELSTLISDKLDREGLGLREAALQCGVSAATLSRVVNGKVPDTASFAALVRWLDVSADLFIQPNKSLTGPEPVEAHLRADRTLPPATARALAALVRAAYSDFGSAATGE